jgi:signal transduction histidine kinase
VKLFDKATLKLTALYTGVLMLISIGFSVAVGVTASQEMGRPFSRPSRVVMEIDDVTFEDIIRIHTDQTNGRILAVLILINLGVLTLGAGLSYLLARLTLQPIEQAMEAQARFVSDASHELKTPLAAVAMENEVILRDKKADKQELRATVESNLEEVKKLQQLTDTLLQISEGQTVEKPKERAVIIEQIVKILTENAIKHDPKHRQPTIERTEKVIKVIDQGPGIAAADLPHIFDRFYRAEKSRTSDGFGLGLALAQHLAHKIGAEIVAENNQGGGATFTVQL